MKTLARLLLFVAAPALLRAVPTDALRSPITVVSENVHVSVGPKMALVVGRYWYQYVPKLDDVTPRVAIQYAAYVPKGISGFDELLEISQVKMMVGEREFRPEDARVLQLEELGELQALPEDAAVAWFTFQIPRDLARLRFDVVISHFQPHYEYEKKKVAAYLPWLPQLEEFRRELELLDTQFLVTFEALPDTRMEPLTTNAQVKESSGARLVVHPRHFENIAVAVYTDAAPVAPTE